MDKYYYLIAQLPGLEFGKETYLTRDFFLEEAAKWLSEKDWQELEKTGFNQLKDGGKSSFLRKYQNFELTLRRELVDYRKGLSADYLAGAGQEKVPDFQPGEVLTRDLLEGNPLEVEKKILFFRWQKAEELAQGSAFSLEAVLAYFLKLEILETMKKFDREKGAKEFESLTEVEDEKIR